MASLKMSNELEPKKNPGDRRTTKLEKRAFNERFVEENTLVRNM